MTVLYACLFVLSGAAGLIYESIWSRYLGLIVGHSAYAQVIVLVIFLGGMSAGAALVARRAERLREPLVWYAGVELVVGAVGFAFHGIFTAAGALAYDTLFPALSGGIGLLIAKWALAALLILPQSVLLGATFPLMTAGVLRRIGNASERLQTSGHVLGLLYFANSSGAAVGVLVAGFYLIGRFGLPGTIATAATLNVIVALGTYGLTRLERAEDPDTAPFGATAGAPPSVDPDSTVDPGLRGRLWRLLLTVSVGTAIASFIYEIAWIRMLSLVLGSATHAFELMLSAFILGLALGALLIRGAADRTRDPVRLLGVVQFAMGTLAILTLTVYLDAFHWMATLLQTVQRNETGYVVFNITRYGVALAVMLPATICSGMTLPLITRSLLAVGVGERAIGAVYAWNTLGSIIGVTLASLVLMPVLGLRGVLILGGALDIAIGIGLLWGRAHEVPALRRTSALALAAGASVVLWAVLSPAFDPGVLSSGVFRYGTVPAPGTRDIWFYEDGRTASVSVQFGSDSGFTLATNGKPDASLTKHWFNDPAPDSLRPALHGDDATQTLLALITLAHVPQAREAAVIGHGSGMSSHFLLGSPAVDWLTTIEIEPAMVAASRTLYPANERVFTDPRSRTVSDDARSYFAAAARPFDLILSEPSNPWVSGVSGLFTQEFYAQVARQLAPGGVFGQWLHLYEIDDELVLSILGALHRNFRSFELFLTNDVDVLVVASNADELPAPDWTVVALDDIAFDLRRFRPLTAQALEATRLITSAELAPVLDARDGANSDFRPRLDLGAERARFMGHEAASFSILPSERFDLAAALGNRRIPLARDWRPALTHARFDAQALAYALRSGTTLTDTDDLEQRLRVARLRDQRLRLELASGRPPVDWPLWFAEALQVERDRHQGTMGDVDLAWYADVERYMVAQRAPAGALSALRFLRAAVSYDWLAASREVATQVAERDRGTAWLSPTLLLDASVIARLRTGDVAGARAVFARLSNAGGRVASDPRTQLLGAHVTAAEQALRANPAAVIDAAP
jgi:predicted membrane-bound spermidine synthase